MQAGTRTIFPFSTRQAGTIYSLWKSGQLSADKTTINRMYDIAKNGFPTEMCLYQKEHLKGAIFDAVEWIHIGNTHEAQRIIDFFARCLTAKTEAEFYAFMEVEMTRKAS